MIVNVIDTETTSLEGGVCEIAHVGVNFDSGQIEGFGHSLIDPKEPISFGAMGIHHITDDMVKGEQTLDQYIEQNLSDGFDAYAAHNAPFDKEKMPSDHRGRDWICTLRCAKHLLPDSDSHANQSLRYELDLDVSDMPKEAGGLAHRALYDTWCTAKLLLKLKSMSDESLLHLSDQPVLLKTINFGKHRGVEWSKAPKDYLRWISKQDFDEDVLHTARHYA